MGERADWMEPVDDDILELLREDEIFEPSQLSDEGLCRGPRAAYRCRELTARGLLRNPMTGVYEITDRGERYLDGDLDASELESADE